MPLVEIYTTENCPFCLKAKTLLENKKVEYSEYKIEGDRSRMREMLKRCRLKTVPQIFIDSKHIGDYEAVSTLEQHGKLDQLLFRGQHD